MWFTQVRIQYALFIGNKFEYTSSNTTYHFYSASPNLLLEGEKSKLDIVKFHYTTYDHTSYTSSRTIFLDGDLCD